MRVGFVTARLLWFVVLANGAWYLATSFPDDWFGIVVGSAWTGLMCLSAPAFFRQMRRLRAETEAAAR